MKNIAVIDIGSNSIRLVVAEIHDNGTMKIIDDLKESVRLAADMIGGNKINNEKMEQAIATLKVFKDFCDDIYIDEYFIFATEAVRKAENKDTFLSKIKELLHFDVKILTGEEESYYDSIGITNSIYIVNSLMVEIGGSSTKLAWINNNKMIKCASLPFGSVNLTQMFNLEDYILYNKEKELKEYIVSNFKNINWLFETTFDSIIGIGGTVRNIGKIDRKNKRYCIDVHHNYEMTSDDVRLIYNTIKSKNLKQRQKIDGLSRDRADIFVGPTGELNFLMELLKIDKLIVSGKGIREGMIYDYINNNISPIKDVLDFSIKNVITNHNLNEYHANNVYKVTKMLFEGLKPIHHLGSEYNKIIKTASMLHDCGTSIRYYDHHKHSFYIILNSSINGLTHKELLLSAFAAASHRNLDLDINSFQYNSVVNRIDLMNIEKIGCLLRLAESFDKSMCGKVTSIDCDIESDAVILKVYSRGNIDLEISVAKKSAHFFKEIYDRELIIIKQ